MRHTLAGLSDSECFARVAVGGGVQTAADALNQASLKGDFQVLRRDIVNQEIVWAQHSGPADQPYDAIELLALRRGFHGRLYESSVVIRKYRRFVKTRA